MNLNDWFERAYIVGDIDKVQQAEWKLQGLCEVCGSDRGPFEVMLDAVDHYPENNPCLYKRHNWAQTNKKWSEKTPFEASLHFIELTSK